MARPNILVITTDQQRWDALSLWGTPGYRTPNIDRLAQVGACFDRSYCPSPVCTPARVSMITGQYSTRHGAYTIGVSPAPALEGPTLGTLFTAAGYHTGLIGKTHFVARQIEDQHVAGVAPGAPCPGSDFWHTFNGPYCGFQHVRHHRHHNAAGRPNAHYRVWLEDRGADMEHIDALHGDGSLRPRVGAWDGMDPELTQNNWIARETVACIDTARRAEKPWLVMAHFQDPHYPYVCPEPYYSDVAMEGVDTGGGDGEDMGDKPPFYRRFLDGKYWTDSEDMHFWDGICIPDTKLHDKQRDPVSAVRAYIGMMNMVDHYVGTILRWLEDTGQFENTLILFTSDHGDMLGRHGMWGKGVPAYDDNQRVPGIMHWAAAQPGPRGHVRSHFNHVDILPTACDAAGLDPPPGVQGISALPVLRGEAECVRDWALVDHVASRNQSHPELDTVDLHQTTFVWEEWKLVVYAHAEYGELYDLRSDPHQRINRWATDREQRHRMLLRLARANMERSGTLPRRIGPC